MTTNKSKSTINNAAVYFVNELRPAYDICYKLTSEPIELMDDLTGLDKKSTESILKKFIKKREDFNKRNQKARDVSDIKKEIEKCKLNIDKVDFLMSTDKKKEVTILYDVNGIFANA